MENQHYIPSKYRLAQSKRDHKYGLSLWWITFFCAIVAPILMALYLLIASWFMGTKYELYNPKLLQPGLRVLLMFNEGQGCYNGLFIPTVSRRYYDNKTSTIRRVSYNKAFGFIFQIHSQDVWFSSACAYKPIKE